VKDENGKSEVLTYPEAVLLAAARQTFDEWTQFAAGMLPDPVVGENLYRHPWLDRFEPETLRRPKEVRAAVRAMRRELNRIQFTRMADKNLARLALLASLESGLEPALFSTSEAGLEQLSAAEFRDSDFAEQDDLRRLYAEVDRLLLTSTLNAVRTYLNEQFRADPMKWEKLEKRNTYPIADLVCASSREPPAAFVGIWYAARRGVPHAQYLLGTYYEKGLVVETKDAVAAFELFLAAAKQGHPLALEALEDY
jgi:TPR repeat protein